jgi:hypothetical protein
VVRGRISLSADCGSIWTPLGSAPRAELLHVLRLPDFDRAERIGEFWGYPETRTFGELLIDPVEDKATKAVVWAAHGEMERGPA